MIAKCRGAGIRVFMVTGDYALTAAAIATEIGIFTTGLYDTVEQMREKRQKLGKVVDATGMDDKRLAVGDGVSSLLLTGPEIETLQDEEWRSITEYREIVLARTTPEQKLKTVKEFRSDGYIVAVTGDGGLFIEYNSVVTIV